MFFSLFFSLYAKVQSSGTFHDDKEAMKTAVKTVRTPDAVKIVEVHFEVNPTESVRRAAQKLGIDRRSLQRILKELKLFPYKFQITQPVNDDHKERRMEFAVEILERISNNTFDSNKCWFSDEAYFSLDGHLNKQNVRHWGRSKPEVTVTRSLHPQKVLVWAAISADGVFGPVFIDGTQTAASYNELLQNEFFPFLQQRGLDGSEWFMQDGARPHRTAEVFSTLETIFGAHVIGLDFPAHAQGGIEWPPYSPDLNPCDYFL